jgi:4-hydroxy-4-methyl-2-oxoglutarate aldolase
MSTAEHSAAESISLTMMRRSLYTAVVCDALDMLGYHNQAVPVPLPCFTGIHRLVGRCKTTLWADAEPGAENPYALELKAVDSCQPDDVIIAAAGGALKSGIWGELLSTAASHRGCVGVIVDGAVRDVAAMTAMGFPAFARSVCPYDSKDRQAVVDMDLPVQIGGLVVRPGDLVFADQDGIVVVPVEVEKEAVRRAWAKVHAENVTRQAIRNGMKITEAFEKYGVL